MTAGSVRRGDTSRSPMLKVMDLFRHRSNSAVSEADKRKAVSNINYVNTTSASTCRIIKRKQVYCTNLFEFKRFIRNLIYVIMKRSNEFD